MKPVHWLILVVPLLMAGQCDTSKINVSEACEVLRATLYQDGQFMLNDTEIDALTEKNQIKIDSVKRYYRKQCIKK